MGKNLFCDKKDLTNESSVEAFFVSRLLNYLGYSDGDIRTKQSIGELFIGKGAKKEKLKQLVNYISKKSILARQSLKIEEFEFYKPSIDFIKDTFTKAHNIIWKKEK